MQKKFKIKQSAKLYHKTSDRKCRKKLSDHWFKQTFLST